MSDTSNRRFTISEVTEIIGVNGTHVVRYWEAEFPQLKPHIDPSGKRYYSELDLAIVLLIKHMLKEEGCTIPQARQRLIKMLKVIKQ